VGVDGPELRRSVSEFRHDEEPAGVAQSGAHHECGRRNTADLAMVDPVLWHARPVHSLLERVERSADGLSDDEAERRLRQFSPNRLPPPQRASAFRVLLDLTRGDYGVSAPTVRSYRARTAFAISDTMSAAPSIW